jgi:type I restriction enzyme S subunit
MSELPNQWASVPLGALAEYLNGAAFKPSDWTDDGMPIIRIQNLTDHSKPFNRTNRTIPEQLRVRNGDILVSWSATLDAFMWDRGEAWLNQHIFRVLPKEDIVDKQFLFYLLKQEIAQLIQTEHLHGSTMKHINRGPFLGHNVPLPPLAEQRRIVAKLDSLFAHTRRARAELARIPALVEAYKQAILAAAFRGDLTVDSSKWKLQPLSDVADLQLGKMLDQAKNKGKPTPYLRNVNVRWYRFDLSDIGEMNFTDAEQEKYAIRRGDILVCEGGEPGRAAVWQDDDTTLKYQKALHRVRVHPEVVPEWLVYQLAYLSSSGELENHFTGTTIKHLPQQALGRVLFMIPPLDEQQSLIIQINEAFDRMALLTSEVQRVSMLLDRLDQANLAKAFRGELVPQDPNDEPAAALLDRIRTERAGQSQAKGRSSQLPLVSL